MPRRLINNSANDKAQTRVTKSLPSFSLSQDEQTISYDFKVLIPAVGGGSVSQEVDSHYPVRTSALKGQLRWWWRLLRVSGYFDEANERLEDNLSTEDLFKEEANIWGAAVEHQPSNIGGQSKVWLSVTIDKPFELAPLATYKCELDRRNNENKSTCSWTALNGNEKGKYFGLEYAYFPILDRPDSNAINNKNDGEIISRTKLVVATGSEFSLRARLSHELSDLQAQQVTQTLRCFALLGSIGSRGRRGLGKLEWLGECRDSEIHTLLQDLQTKCFLDIRQLANNFSPVHSLDAALNKYRNFRQSRRGGRHRSYWPEPDSIRYATGWDVPHHAPSSEITDLGSQGSYPRSVFGLPIVFKFKNGDDNPEQAAAASDRKNRFEPPLTSLELSDSGRFSSPLLFMTIPYKGEYRTVVLKLPEQYQLGESELALKGSHAVGKQKVSGQVNLDFPIQVEMQNVSSTVNFHVNDNAIDKFLSECSIASAWVK